MPELDKLIRLSEIFGVSLDELILDKKQGEPAPEPEPRIVYVERPATHSGQKTAGVILLCFAALMWLLIALFGDAVSGLVLAAPFVACGVICLRTKKLVGLWCAWVIYLFVELYLRFATGINWGYVFRPQVYASDMTVHLIVAWCLMAVFAALTVVTAFLTRKAFPGKRRNDWIGTLSCWAAYLITGIIGAFLAQEAANAVVYPLAFRYGIAALGWARSVILVVAVVFTIRLVLSFRERKAV